MTDTGASKRFTDPKTDSVYKRNVNQLWIDSKSEALTEKGAKMTKRLIDSLNKSKVNLDSGKKDSKTDSLNICEYLFWHKRSKKMTH